VADSWKVSGSYFESCNCDVACPCVFLSPPTAGECTVLLAWHIDRGQFGGTTLDGLNAALAAYSPGHMLATKWKVALYVDQRAKEEQQTALVRIFSGQAGGHLANLVPLIGEVLGVRPTGIEYVAEGKRRTVRIGDVAAAEIEGLTGQNDADVTLGSVPFTAVPGVALTVAKSKQMRLTDHGFRWEVSNKNGFFAPFTYQST
jgi:hypothetical protein